VSFASKLRFESLGAFVSTAFYAITGIILLIMLPLSGFPPHVAITGIASIIAAAGLFLKMKWSMWLIAALFFAVSVFTIYTLYYVMATNAMAAILMAIYAVLTWAFTFFIASNRNTLLN